MTESLATAKSAAGVAEAVEGRARRLYEEDGYTWAMEQARALRNRDLAAIDWVSLIEEVEYLARSERRNWESLCARAIQHLLLVQFRGKRLPDAVRGWIHEVQNFSDDMADLIRKNPGLKRQYESMFGGAWHRGRRLARNRLVDCEMERPGPEQLRAARKSSIRHWDMRLPADCPYSLQDVAALDPERDREPCDDEWPPVVARVLDESA